MKNAIIAFIALTSILVSVAACDKRAQEITPDEAKAASLCILPVIGTAPKHVDAAIAEERAVAEKFKTNVPVQPADLTASFAVVNDAQQVVACVRKLVKGKTS